MAENESSERIVMRVRLLDRDDVAELGDLPVFISLHWREVSRRNVVLTGERKRHILDGHPEMQDLIPALIRTVQDPDEIHRNKLDTLVAIFWRRIEDQDHYLRIALLLSPAEELQHSVMSAWRVRRKDYEREGRQERRVWKKGE